MGLCQMKREVGVDEISFLLVKHLLMIYARIMSLNLDVYKLD